MSKKREVEPHDLAALLVLEFFTRPRSYVLLVSDAPVDVLVSDHRVCAYSLVWSRVVERPGDPFASLDLAVLGSAHVVSGLSCWGRVMSEVVGSGWTHVTFLRTVGVGSPGLASLTPLSGGGSGPSRVLFFVILSPRSGFSGGRSSG